VSGDSVVSGIFIKNVIAGSSADKCGLLKVGDRILGENFVISNFIPVSYEILFLLQSSAVDGVDIRNSSHEIAVKTIKNASYKMMLLVQSLNASVIKFTPCFTT
jgi:C-terminal processing protease CtpA/Prc